VQAPSTLIEKYPELKNIADAAADSAVTNPTPLFP
jgi:hypothetical protein